MAVQSDFRIGLRHFDEMIRSDTRPRTWRLNCPIKLKFWMPIQNKTGILMVTPISAAVIGC
jgi:hypothetical protein